MQFFIHCSFFYQEYKFTYLLAYLLTYLLTDLLTYLLAYLVVSKAICSVVVSKALTLLLKQRAFTNLTQTLWHKIVHIAIQCKHNYIESMILKISVQSGTRAASIA